MLPTRFELVFPEISQAREARILDRARRREHLVPGGFEPPSQPPEGRILDH